MWLIVLRVNHKLEMVGILVPSDKVSGEVERNLGRSINVQERNRANRALS